MWPMPDESLSDGPRFESGSMALERFGEGRGVGWWLSRLSPATEDAAGLSGSAHAGDLHGSEAG